jgi:hypothetical protein
MTTLVESWLEKAPVWMSRPNIKRFVSSMILLADLGIQALNESLFARFPGLGTPTALPLIGKDRGIPKGMSDTSATWAAKLIKWIDRWRTAGSQRAVAQAIQDYCTDAPRVRVVNRNGCMTTLEHDGSFSFEIVTWDWDSLSHPRRNDPDEPYWSELFIVVYTPPWDVSPPWGTSSVPDQGLGQLCPRVDVDAIKALLEQWKSAHTYVRAVLWSYDATLFDPSMPATMPDGTWGSWSYTPPDENPSHCQLSGRGLLEQSNDLRTWEPMREPPENLLPVI